MRANVVAVLVAALLACGAATARAQEGSLQVSGTAQGITGDPPRIAGQSAFEPDAGVSWLQPGSRAGSLQLDLRATQRAGRFHLGRMYAAARDLPLARLAWTFEGGDAYLTRPLGEYRFTNLTTPAVTFSGGAVAGRGARGFVQIAGGRATAWRNIFGSDPDTLAQTLAVAHGGYRAGDRVEMFARASRFRTRGLKEFAFDIADSRQAGGGVRITLTPAVQLIGDAGYVQYRRRDSAFIDADGSWLAGASVLLGRGWLQLNASRFSPGEFPAMNDPLHDREALFAAGEYDVARRLRLFGGWEGFRTSLDPPPPGALPAPGQRTESARGFGGLRLQVGERSAVTVRGEDGGSLARPIHGGLDFETDAGSWSAEWQAAYGAVSSYARVSRRENVSRTSLQTSHDQRDVAAQLFVRVSPGLQLFGTGTLTRHETETAASAYWQGGGGAQLQIARRGLWVRGEGTASRNVDRLARRFVPRESFNLGINGRLSARTLVSVNVAAHRTPLLLDTGTPWTTRALVRVTRTFSTGTARAPRRAPAGGAAEALARGSGTIVGRVFVDWDQDGTPDPDEEPLENIAVRLGPSSRVATAPNGEFAFVRVPAGRQHVRLDTSAIPVDFDPPAAAGVEIDMDRSETLRVTFGLLPLGSIRGRVLRDANGNGRIDPADEPLDAAVLVLDDGARSEQVRRGEYRFEAVRAGSHAVALLPESLPARAVVVGQPQVEVVLDRSQMAPVADFLVVLDRRPENRRIFPARTPPPAAGPAPGTPASSPARPSVRPPPRRVAASLRQSGLPEGDAASTFSVQVAAVEDARRAAGLVRDLSKRGFPALVVQPEAGDGDRLDLVRVGRYPTRADAALERLAGEMLRIVGPSG